MSPISLNSTYTSHEYYIDVNFLIRKSVRNIREGVGKGENLIELFHQTLDHLSLKCKELALKYGINKFDLQGVRRDQEECFTGVTYVTLMKKDLSHERLVTMIEELLQKIHYPTQSFKRYREEFPTEQGLKRHLSREITIYKEEELEIYSTPSFEECLRLCQLCSFSSPENPSQSLDLYQNLLTNKQAMLALKEKSFQDYQKLKLYSAILEIKHLYPRLVKVDWILVTQNLQVKGKRYELSEYLTWIFRDIENPIEKMKKEAMVTIIHQDPFLISPMLENIARIFKKAIRYNRYHLSLIKKQVALLRYELAHATPYKRGGNSISWWLERIIFNYHQYEPIYLNDPSINIEALTFPLKEFVEKYEEYMRVETMEANEEAKNRLNQE
ncbi:hypothetical protein DB41_CO00140 [Neochlamydia sp. TUME1]|uniref:hypothetical protein n=1 Tax=Neochlamydia sp. TUME1 TaxID=1478174 RepID=UPI000582AC12|nr:hypothetical protein [Neochlamydia sp. TUME1]KIC77245.1 hypothetical protein DB41_CO00140 [Neochlamydia sp. TUME1]